MSFHDVLFPPEISRGSQGGPERRTDVVTLASGGEERNGRWADSRRAYNAGYGVKSLDDLHSVVSFFEERRGRLYGFRWRDHADAKSCLPSGTPGPLDQEIGVGDAIRTSFQLTKTYGLAFAPFHRVVTRPVAASVTIAVAGAVQSAAAFAVDATSGVVTFSPGHVPPPGAIVTAGFLFDVPVRFDTDKLEVDLTGFHHGSIPSIPIVEIRA